MAKKPLDVGAKWKRHLTDHPLAIAVSLIAFGFGVGYGFDELVHRQLTPTAAAAGSLTEPCRLHEFHIPKSKWGTDQGADYTCDGTKFSVLVRQGTVGAGRPGRQVILKMEEGNGHVTPCAPVACPEGSGLGEMMVMGSCPILDRIGPISCESPDETVVLWKPIR